MPSCIVCHLEISLNRDSYFECNNEHPIHSKCLAQWILHSQNCPLCSDPYPQSILDKFKDFIEYKEQEKQSALEDEQKKKQKKK